MFVCSVYIYICLCVYGFGCLAFILGSSSCRLRLEALFGPCLEVAEESEDSGKFRASRCGHSPYELEAQTSVSQSKGAVKGCRYLS